MSIVAQGENGFAARTISRTTVGAADLKNKKIIYSGSKIAVSKKVPGAVYMYLNESCSGKSDANSSLSKLTLKKGKKGIASAAGVLAKIKIKKVKL